MELLESMRMVGSSAYRALLQTEMESSDGTDDSPVTCVVADGVMPFAITVTEEMGFPAIAFRTESACGFLAYLSVPRLLKLGEITIPSDEQVRGVPGMEGFLRRRDLPRVVPKVDDVAGGGTDTDPVPVLLTIADTAAHCRESRTVILNTAVSMEGPALEHIAPHMRDVFAVGPLHARAAVVEPVSLRREDDDGCTAWLDGHEDRTVVYVNLGSLTIVSRVSSWLSSSTVSSPPATPSCACSSSVVLQEALEAVAEAGDRALVVEWAHRDVHCVLQHRAVGCFMMHAGWNSTLEAAVEGVPVVCWPFFADQPIVSRFVGAVWKTGLDMKDVCDRAVVERMVREAMESAEITASAQAIARQLRLDVAEGGSSSSELKRLVGFVTELSAMQIRSTDAENNSSPARVST